jgi:SacI restriction endonuclease
MGLQINRAKAREIFRQALALARSGESLPAEWVERTRKVGTARSITFTPALGTGLLAKATDRRIDALSLSAGAGHKTYSARGLATAVLVPCCAEEGIDLRSTGREPLNNQPFFGKDRIGPDLNVHDEARGDLEYLTECLTSADFLENDDALRAFAAFLRTRIEATAEMRHVDLGKGVLSLDALVAALDQYLAGDSEGGKTGQAAVAAILDLVYADVRTKRINDPSRSWPGDVGVFTPPPAARSAEALVLCAEVKHRPFSPTEILLFTRKLAAFGTHRAVVIALQQEGQLLDEADIQGKALNLHGVFLVLFGSAGAFLRDAMQFGKADLPELLALFPARCLARLEELEVSDKRRVKWAALFQGS